MFGAVIAGHAIADDRAGFERTEAVRKARWHPQLIVLLGREGHSDPPSITRRIDAQIDGNVEQLAREAANELTLSCRGRLKMQAADRARPDAERLVVLDELYGARSIGEGVQSEDLGKIAAVILDLARLDLEQALNFKLAKFQTLTPALTGTHRAYRT